MINEFRGKYYFLSNFYPTEVTVDGKTYPSSEHAYMRHKSEDWGWEEACLNPKFTPAQIKRGSRKVRLRDDWDSVKIPVMEKVLRAKFENPDLAKRLLETGDEELIEGNWWNDIFWGVCNGVGENHLGKTLMKIREEIRKSKTQ